ncbi:MAG: transposase [Bacteroidales bacterium]|nr:transposase [Bacteroidales bacterium]
MKDRIECIASHIVFTLKYSRYDYQRIKRINPKGYVATTLPYFDDKEEDAIIEELCNVAGELKLELIAFNFCGDHVHCIVCSERESLSKMMLLWKGKTSYNYNRRINLSSKGSSARIKSTYPQGLWAKSFYQKVLRNETELCNAINYVVTNRKKHGLKPLSQKSSQLIRNATRHNEKI